MQAAGAAVPAAHPVLAPIPPLHEWRLPGEWRQVDFISDLHLCAEMPRTFGALQAHLAATRADAVCILGDLFEVWVGDDAISRPFERRCVEMLAAASTQRQILFMHGNRDFLAGRALLQGCGMGGLADPTVLDAWGQRLLLSHGDALCLADAPYQAFRAQVRGLPWQHEFLSRPLADRLRIAADIRNASRTRRQFDGDAGADVDTANAVAWMHALGCSELVHGHTHRPGSDVLAPGFKRHVLSDWDLDHADRAEVLRLSRDGLERVRPHGA